MLLKYFVVFHIYKVGVWFTSPSEHMHHTFGNESFQNCPLYFGLLENDDQHVLSGYTSSCVSFVRGFGSVTPLFSVTPILGVLSENGGVMLSKSRTKDT
jgi:hypothetical protein